MSTHTTTNDNLLLDETDDIESRFAVVAEVLADGLPFACSGCSSQLDSHPPQPRQSATIVLCPDCGVGHVVSGQADDADERFTTESVSLLRTTESRIDRILNTLKSDLPTSSDERRGSARTTVTTPITAVPYDPGKGMLGKGVPMLTKNVSQGGACLVSDLHVPTPLIVLDFTASGIPGLQVVMQILRRRFLGTHHEIAGRFIVDMASEIEVQRSNAK
ncbi:MAG: hypothetical protein AAGF31_12010 [Planctomycetota bacterium]